MLLATCHCGAINVEVPEAPTIVSDCNCSICRRYGVVPVKFLDGASG